MNPRDLIDFAQDDNGVEFRKALYANIHDKVMQAIESKKQEIASNLINNESDETDINSEEEITSEE
jgi:hypothetical protein